ncbi:hypothetical protein acsn021_43690 [Anaerocolumna cellulosilytica]|uniref:Uncharacterized protein n=1 Tax=Anaerocolumna cellulosilytica TaxID=433286 RepID=A0A6S6RBC6_9FIRM|nr:pentapeptide repeat-containing protein [Anaerocolumna cellulosilytica]MBB5195326.1 uncharacterized protein YjbI with pentapeptide repeats [Anaerocolumna cellulosilytica]BCJ96800.1 hypothetical protein acsn021_43690 [Anaerocolumna cellulosilytica]
MNMIIHDESAVETDLIEELKIDCSKCSGLCCTALFFSEMDGFPEDKAAGKPCINLQSDFRCKVHTELMKRNMKGCIGYDCFGAGQKVTEAIYNSNWRTEPTKSQEMFNVFLVTFQIHQILYFLAEAKTIIPARELWSRLNALIKEGRDICKASPHDILLYDIDGYRKQVNECLRKVKNLVKSIYNHKKEEYKRNFIGKSYKGKKFDGVDLSMSLLISTNFEGCSFHGANFLGADTRDTNFNSADLREAVFLTQGQVNSARGNSDTKLPRKLCRPITWI